VTISACGSGSNRLYDAKATYSCLTKQPDYRPQSFDWYPGKPGVARPPALAFYLFQPAPRGVRHVGNWPWQGPNVGPSWGFGPYPVDPLRSSAIRLAIFDQAKSARAAYREILRRILPSFQAEGRETIQVIRNAYIDSNGEGPNLKRMWALVVGCLRTG
jgi:hypothetical protein